MTRVDERCCATNVLSMSLEGDELRRRIVAAGGLHGLGMRQIRDQLELFGADKTLAEGMISGRVPQNPRNIRDLAEALGMPQAWFTEPDWRTLVRSAPETGSDLAEGARARAAEVLARGRTRSPEEPPATHRNRGGG